MSLPLTTLRQYPDIMQAETIRIRLEAAGIRAFVTGTDMATALSMGGASARGLVQVKVPESEFDRAYDLLVEDERRLSEAGPWICGRCHEQNEAAFEVCWSCDKPRTDTDERGRVVESPPSVEVQLEPPPSVPEPSPIVDDANPYRPVVLEKEKPKPPQQPAYQMAAPDVVVEAAKRCFRAAVIGILIFPPLVSIYGVYLLVRVHAGAYRYRTVRRRLLIAWIINLVNIPAWLIFWTQFQ